MKFDWAQLLRAAISAGLRPAEFWQLTPAEFELIVGGVMISPLNRSRLDEMVQQFPDEVKENMHVERRD